MGKFIGYDGKYHVNMRKVSDWYKKKHDDNLGFINSNNIAENSKLDFFLVKNLEIPINLVSAICTI